MMIAWQTGNKTRKLIFYYKDLAFFLTLGSASQLTSEIVS